MSYYKNVTYLLVRAIDDVTGSVLPGAAFELLQQGRVVRSGTTNAKGEICFCVEPCSRYILRELTPPPGYKVNGGAYRILVDECGHIFIDGQRTDQITVKNSADIRASFTAIKVNAENGASLAGAKYTLFSNGLPVRRAVSSDTGAVIFTGLAPGSYELIETEAPSGFRPSSSKLTVTVTDNGSVTICEPAEGYHLINTPVQISCLPVIYQIVENSTVIRGTGVPGAAICVLFSNGARTCATVAPDGAWELDVPAGLALRDGDSVSVTQKEPGKDISGPVVIVVGGTPDGYGYKLLRNLSRTVNYRPGDVLEFAITVGNNAGAAVVWPHIAVTDVIHIYTSLVPGSVRIDGVKAVYGTGEKQYTYDENTRILTVRLGNILPEEEFIITYRAKIVDDWGGGAFNNHFEAAPEDMNLLTAARNVRRVTGHVDIYNAD